MFGAMNTMMAIVAARTREIGTLRALGFSRLSIRLVVTESTLLALAVESSAARSRFRSTGYPVGGANLRRLPLRFALRRRP